MKMIELPRWYIFKRRVRRWFWHSLLRRPDKWRNWTSQYTNITVEEADEKIRRAIQKIEWRKPELRNPVSRAVPIFVQIEPRMPETPFYGNDDEKT